MKARTQTPDELGSLDAPRGSREWAIAVRTEAFCRLSDQRNNARSLRSFVALMAEHEGWKELRGPDGKHFRTFEAFCSARSPFGLGMTADEIALFARETGKAG